VKWLIARLTDPATGAVKGRAARAGKTGLVLLALLIVAWPFLAVSPWNPFDDRPPVPPPPDAGERVELLDVALHFRANGVISVRESFHYNFGTSHRSLFTRRLEAGGSYLDLWSQVLGNVRGRSDSSAQVSLRTYGPNLGTGKETVVSFAPPRDRWGWTGRHLFVIGYDLHRTQPGGSADTTGAEFSFGVVSADWKVPIDVFRATVTADGTLDAMHCDVVGDAANEWDRKRACDRHRKIGLKTFTAEESAVPNHEGKQGGIAIAGRFPHGFPEPPIVGRLLLWMLCVTALFALGTLVMWLFWRGWTALTPVPPARPGRGGRTDHGATESGAGYAAGRPDIGSFDTGGAGAGAGGIGSWP